MLWVSLCFELGIRSRWKEPLKGHYFERKLKAGMSRADSVSPRILPTWQWARIYISLLIKNHLYSTNVNIFPKPAKSPDLILIKHLRGNFLGDTYSLLSNKKYSGMSGSIIIITTNFQPNGLLFWWNKLISQCNVKKKQKPPK